MHPAGGVKLPHGGIDDGETGLPLLPGPQFILIAAPGDLVGPGDKRPAFTQFRVVNHQMTIELAPDNLVQPACARFAIQRAGLLP